MKKYNVYKIVNFQNDRPQYPQKVLKTEVLNNPFQDIVSRIVSERKADDKESKKKKKSGVK